MERRRFTRKFKLEAVKLIKERGVMLIDPPDRDPPPKWTQVLVNAANARNRARKV
jgi:hypothetical protein